MNDKEVARNAQRLEALFGKASSLPNDPELQSHFAKYLCVLTAGFLEQSIRTLYGRFCESQASPRVVRYVAARLRGFQNPKMGKIIELTEQFDKDWGQSLKQRTEGEVKDAVDSIMDNRHRIAHGVDVSLGLVGIRKYYKAAKRVLDFIEELTAPQ